jgi:hypothetical protein
MDVEKTMEFLLEQQAQFQARMEASQARMDASQARMDASDARFEARMNQMAERQLQAEERADREIAAIRAELRRGIRLSIEEQRRERQRRQELADIQKVTEQKLQALIDSLKQPRNGH